MAVRARDGEQICPLRKGKGGGGGDSVRSSGPSVRCHGSDCFDTLLRNSGGGDGARS